MDKPISKMIKIAVIQLLALTVISGCLPSIEEQISVKENKVSELKQAVLEMERISEDGHPLTIREDSVFAQVDSIVGSLNTSVIEIAKLEIKQLEKEIDSLRQLKE